jgi:type II secretory pathway pseudopilin PulG
MDKRVKSFTMVELIVTIVILLILSSFVVVSVIGAQEKAEDNKKISNANIFASALNQYAMDNGRKYVGIGGLGVLDKDKYYGINGYALVTSTFAQKYLSDAADVLGSGVQYIVKGDLTRAAIITAPQSTHDESNACNFSDPSVPIIIQKYKAGATGVVAGSGFQFYTSPSNMACYYVAL